MACGLASPWTNADLLSIKPYGIYLHDILFAITSFHSGKCIYIFKMSAILSQPHYVTHILILFSYVRNNKSNSNGFHRNLS